MPSRNPFKPFPDIFEFEELGEIINFVIGLIVRHLERVSTTIEIKIHFKCVNNGYCVLVTFSIKCITLKSKFI